VPDDSAELIEGIRSGDRRSLARAITLVESTRADHRAEAATVLEAVLPSTGGSVRIGISGSPGVGKSTFIEAFGLHLVGLGHRVAVLAVDPSSARTGGSILGDKTRMAELSRHPDAFIRPSPGGTQLGGVARRTREAMLLCEAFGFDVVIVETIGVGQSEVAVADMVDLFLLLVAPGGGRRTAGDQARDHGAGRTWWSSTRRTATWPPPPAAPSPTNTNALHLVRPRWAAWTATATKCSALEHAGHRRGVAGGRGVPGGDHGLGRIRRAPVPSGSGLDVVRGAGHPRRPAARRSAVVSLVDSLEADVAAGRVTPTTAAQHLLDAFAG